MPNKETKGPIPSGWIFINKANGRSSCDYVKKCKYLLSKSFDYKKLKVGHGGTLDPFASGLLMIAFGEATKVIPYMHYSSKEYIFTMHFGASTDTLDITGNITNCTKNKIIFSQLENAVNIFHGQQYLQVPPKFSAVKVNGKRAYSLARAGQEVDLTSNAKLVNIFSLKIKNFCPIKQSAELVASVSTGTYIRSLCLDIAHSLNNLAYVAKLHRNSVGKLNINLSGVINSNVLYTDNVLDNMKSYIFPLEYVLDFNYKVEIKEAEYSKLMNGIISYSLINNLSHIIDSDKIIAIYYRGLIVAFLQNVNNSLKILRILNRF